MSIIYYENHEYFESHSGIKVHVDYKKVVSNSVENFMNLRN